MFAFWKDLSGCGEGIGEGGQVWSQGDHQESGAITQNLHSDNLNWAVPWAWSNMRGCKEAESIGLVVESGRLGKRSVILEVQLSDSWKRRLLDNFAEGKAEKEPPKS